MFVAFPKMVDQDVFQVLDGFEMIRHLSLDLAEHDLDLIQPKGVDREPVDVHLKGELERVSTAHRLCAAGHKCSEG